MTPVCQRQAQIHSERNSDYNEATRRVTVQTGQQVTALMDINGLSFLSQELTVDLCVTCYAAIKHDPTLTITNAVGLW